MRYSVLSLVAWVLLSAVCFAQPANPSPPWAATLAQNTTAQSGLTVVNRCGQRHSFEIQTQNVPFLTFSQTQLQVNGGQTVNIPAVFNTQGLATGAYQGQVAIACLTCRNEPSCSQDRETVRVVLNVSPPQNQVNNPPPNQNQNPGVNPPAGNAANPPPDPGWNGIPKERIPRVTAVYDEYFGNGLVCPDCEKLRLAAAEKEAAAAEAQKQADAAKGEAGKAEGKAKDAENAAKKAAQQAQPGPDGGTISADGETFSQADSDFLEAKRDALFGEWQAGRITAAQHQAQRAALSGPAALQKAREERLAKLTELKKEAEKAKAAADKARAEAEKANAAANSAQAKADAAKKAADDALEAYRRCLKAAREECERQQAAKAAAAQAQKDRDAKAAAAARAQQDEENRRKQEKRDQAKALFDLEYLFHNIEELKLIKIKIKRKKVPGALDPAFDLLQKLAGQTARDFLQTVTTMIGEGPIPIDYISLLGELYQALPAFLNPCTVGGKQQTKKKLLKMVNSKTGKLYTPDEADVKIEMICDLMNNLKKKLEELKALQAAQGK